MDSTRDIIGRFPIDQLFFIMTTGLFLVLCFPFDIYPDTANGLPQPPLNSSAIPNLYDELNSGLTNLSSYIRTHFEPFVAIKYLNETFPNGLIKILLLSIPAGILVFFLFTLYEIANHFIRHPIESVRTLLRAKKNRANGSPDEENQRLRKEAEFTDWIRKKGHRRFYDFIYSMELVATGLLYACETFILLVILSAIMAARDSPFPYPTERICLWFLASLTMSGFSYAVFKIYTKRAKDDRAEFRKIFNAVNVDPIRSAHAFE